MSPTPKTILVTGATGRQGGSVIENLLTTEDVANFNIVALTRDIASPRALWLSAHINVSVLKGDMSKPEAIFKSIGPVWGVYSVQVNSSNEEQQGKDMIDAAVAHDVRHFIYSSGDRGGPEKSNSNPTNVKNFAAKYHIEKYLEEKAASSPQKMTFTILRPVSFFENLGNDLHGRGFARMWQQMGGKNLQLVSTQDIGWFSAQVFRHPNEYRNIAMTLVGDELTEAKAQAIFKDSMGFNMPLAPCPVASAVKFFLQGSVGDMFRWFEEDGYGGDVATCRQLHPQMKDFKAWIEENKDRWAN